MRLRSTNQNHPKEECREIEWLGAASLITYPGGVGFKSQGLAEALRVTPEILKPHQDK